MNKIIIATGNKNKQSEIETLMQDCNLKFCSQQDLGINSCDEPFDTFVENALAKARHVSKIAGLPAIADDSGICVDVLNGKPGIHSARFSAPKATDSKNIKKLLDLLKNHNNRKAHFHCSIVFIKNHLDPEPFIAEGLWYGEILKEMRGSHGFGYDPIFFDYKTEKSAAEINSEIKNRISHRGQALQKIKQRLKIVYDQNK